MKRKPVARALLSVSDKRGLAELSRALHEGGARLVATFSTAKTISDAGLPVMEVSEVTGAPEMLGGRVKTLHPKIHAGVLADQTDGHALEEIAANNVEPFDMVVVNLYPFAEAVQGGCAERECVEMIDIGGPTLLRAAAKNLGSVAVVSSVDQYEDVIAAIAAGGTTKGFRRDLARQAFQMTAEYDVEVATWFQDEEEPAWSGATYNLVSPLRYGENPHQKASVYTQASPSSAVEEGIVGAEILGGKQLSFNNLRDANAAWAAVNGFIDPTVAIIKHANPSGLATNSDLTVAYDRALACDPLSAFGGIVAANREVDGDTAKRIAKVFTEVVVAPSYSQEALDVLLQKKALRVLQATPNEAAVERYLVPGGMLVQEVDKGGKIPVTQDASTQAPTTQISVGDGSPDEALQDEASQPAWELVAGPAVSSSVLADLRFAWDAVRYVKSNAVLLAKDQATVGIGMGQVSRVDAAKLAVQRANAPVDSGEKPESSGGPTAATSGRSEGAVAASDAFFPFPDGLQVLTDAGVAAVVAPGGSKGDAKVIEAANEAGISLYFAPTRHFWH